MIKWILIFSIMAYSSEFTEPQCLKNNIDFWEKIYMVYDEDEGVIHDKNTFQIIWDGKMPRPGKAKNQRINFLLDSLRFIYPQSDLRYQSGIKSRFLEGLKRHKKYNKTVSKHLEKHDLPQELSFLPHVESSYDPRAKSKVGARGMWQIMPGTAQAMTKRKKNDLNNIEISTGIAMLILKNNYEQTGSWPLALISYNHGLAGVKRAMNKLETNDACRIIDEYDGARFKFASRNFYAQFLAVKRIIDCTDEQPEKK